MGAPRRKVRQNQANEFGGAIFFVSNDRTGSLAIEDSTLEDNPSEGVETEPGIFYIGQGSRPSITRSTLK